MARSAPAKIFPHLWYTKEAEEAAQLYTSIFPNSHIGRVTPLPVDTPSGPAGTVKVVDFTLFGQRVQAITAGPLDPFNHAISLVVLCDDQEEIDRYWNALLKGGKSEACGWLRDKFGVCWQIVPQVLDEMIGDLDPVRVKRVYEAMMKMVKLDVEKLKAAYEGRT
jgi:predicted 3-demethylubiquinone-9 3-methyltransferase (glyoxalase superfamily)